MNRDLVKRFGPPEEYFLIAYAHHPRESFAFRGWRLVEERGMPGDGEFHCQVAVWITVDEKIFIGIQEAEHDENPMNYEGEWTFVGELESLEDADRWISNVTGFGPTVDDFAVANRAVQRAKKRLRGEED